MVSDRLAEILRCPLHPKSSRLTQLADHEFWQGNVAARGPALRCHECGRHFPVVDGIPDMLVKKHHEDSFLEAEEQQWDGQADKYETRRREDAVYMAGIDAVVSDLAVCDDDGVLDAGCGTGMAARHILPSVLHLVAFDLSLASLRYLRSLSAGRHLDLVRGNLTLLPFQRETFSKVLCANTLQHVPEDSLRSRSVRELARVANYRARVVISVHNYSVTRRRLHLAKDGAAGGHSGKVQYIYRFERSEFRQLLSQGLSVERIHGAGLPLPYRFKLSPLMRRVEKAVRQFSVSTRWSKMLVGICRRL
jgi:SAM-dependent methyltransferase